MYFMAPRRQSSINFLLSLIQGQQVPAKPSDTLHVGTESKSSNLSGQTSEGT